VKTGITSEAGFTADPEQLRRVLGHFCSGITIITAVLDGEPVGFTCQSFASLSLDPPMVTFSASRGSTTWPKIREASTFCVNVLSDTHSGLSTSFGRSGTDKFAGVRWRSSRQGAPVLDGVVAYFECRVWAEYDGGDHTIVAASVMDLAADSTQRPLVFYRGQYGLPGPGWDEGSRRPFPASDARRVNALPGAEPQSP
jgi:3-hydroxy-9,10-secoandrosta-1,3,5(10)-triene-9,17-dione monooxygenase reductase component